MDIATLDSVKLSINTIIPYTDVDAISNIIIKPNAIINRADSFISFLTCKRSRMVEADIIIE